MTEFWTIVGVGISALAALIGFLQLQRTPGKSDPDKPSDKILEDNEKKLAKAKKAIENKNLLLFLKWKYKNEPVLERCGYIFPVAIYPAHRAQREDVESVLKVPLLNESVKPGEFVVWNPEYLNLVNALKSGGLRLGPKVNLISYSMKTLLVNGKCQMECNLGNYFNSYQSSEILEWEIRSRIDKLKGGDEKDFKKFQKQLTHRQDLHKSVSDPVKSGAGRCAAIGISTLIAYKHKGETKLLMRRRAKPGVPLRAGLLHVIPGFMFQATSDYKELEYSVTYNIFKEYLEELFDKPEELNRNLHPNHIYADKRLQYLLTLLNNGEARLYFTGITMNLLNLRPEICTLLFITNPEWYEKCQQDPELEWNISGEFIKVHESDGIVAPEEFTGEITLADDDQMMKNGCLYPHRTVPAGAGAFWLGVDALRELSHHDH